MGNNRTNVLIIGAGPVGLTIANELVKNGVSVRIIEKLPAIREISKAMIWHVRTQEALDKIGIMDKGKAEAKPLTEVIVHAYGKHIGSWDLDDIDSPFPCPLIIGQNRTQHLLNDLLTQRGANVEWNTEALSIKITSSVVVAELTHRHNEGNIQTETAEFDYVIGCEGSNSLVRKTLNLTFEGERYSGEQFIQADCNIKWVMPSGRSYLFLTKVGYLMVMEMPNGMVRVFISLPDDHEQSGEVKNNLGAAEDISNEPSLGEIKENLERLSGYKVELSNPVWLARYRTSHRYANTFGQGRAFVCGDAAHVHVPIGGQGMNTGIQDAFNLGWKLAGVIKGDYAESILDSYNSERHPVAESLIKGTDFAYKGILHPSILKQRAVKLFGPLLMGTEAAQNFMRNTLEELTVSYPKSPLNLDGGNVGGPKPGSRAEDAVLVTTDTCETTSIYALLKQNNWTLLTFSGTYSQGTFVEAAEKINDELKKYNSLITISYIIADTKINFENIQSNLLFVDANHYAHTKYGADHGALFLVRPDGIIAYRSKLDDFELLLTYLGGIIKL